MQRVSFVQCHSPSYRTHYKKLPFYLDWIHGLRRSSTGCLAISVKSETPLFSDIYRGSRLFFHVVIGYCAGFDFLKKNLKFFFWFRVWARYNSGMVFRLSLVCSKFKFMFSAGIQFFGLKTTSHGKPDLKNWFLRSDLPCEVVFRPKSWIPAENMNLNLLQTRLSLKTRLDLYLALSLTKKILNFFFKKSNATVCTITTWKDSLLCQHKSEKRVCLKKDSNHETPSMFSSISQQKVNGF